MMSTSEQHACIQEALPENKRDAEREKRIVDGRLSRRWSQRLNLDETYRAPAHFTWRF